MKMTKNAWGSKCMVTWSSAKITNCVLYFFKGKKINSQSHESQRQLLCPQWICHLSTLTYLHLKFVTLEFELLHNFIIASSCSTGPPQVNNSRWSSWNCEIKKTRLPFESLSWCTHPTYSRKDRRTGPTFNSFDHRIDHHQPRHRWLINSQIGPRSVGLRDCRV